MGMEYVRDWSSQRRERNLLGLTHEADSARDSVPAILGN